MKYESIIIFGPPYAGKGTQCKLLAEQPDFYHFSSGEMFRSLDQTTSVGARVHKLIAGGNLAPDSDLFKLAMNTLRQEARTGYFKPQQQMLLIDGLPRTAAQIPFVDEIADVKQVLYLDGGSREELTARALHRFAKEGRADDSNLDKIKKRLDIYFKETHPLLEFYEPETVVLIDGRGSANAPTEQLEQRILEINQNILEQIVRKEQNHI